MKGLQIACGLWLACSSVAALACEQPAVPIIPAKQDLGRRERHQILRSTQNYATAMAAYVACIKKDLKAAGGRDAPDLRSKLLTARYETAVREFNVVLTLYTQRIGSLDSLRTGQIADTAQRACISMGSSGKTLALDDSTVLFYPRTGRIYINKLPKECSGLKRSGGGFEFATTRSSPLIEEMCSGDTITLIRGSHAGFTCRLGPFQELTKEQAAALLSERARPDDGSVTVKPVQLPPDKDEASEPGKQR